MADDDPSGDGVAKEWPLEGHVVVGGSGLFVRTDCLGRAFTSRITSRTASYDLTIGLPQLDPGSTSPGRLIPPEWTYGPSDESERANERDAIHWGYAFSDRAQAVVFRCRFYTTFTASNYEEFSHLADDIWIADWWTHFTSWAAILASQDLVGPARWDVRRREMIGPDIEAWTSDAHGQRASEGSFPYTHSGLTIRILELHELVPRV
jgi:hypothetical protein